MAKQLENPSESTSLLRDTSSKTLTDRDSTDSSESPQVNSNLDVCSPQLKHLCLPSKSAILILLWTAVVGMMYYAVICLIAVSLVIYPYDHISTSVHHALCYAILAVVMMFYPLSGFIADVCCGRLKTITISLIVLLTSLIFLLVGALLWTILYYGAHLLRDIFQDEGTLILTLASMFVITFIVGLVGYQANFIQLGLDQFLEAPSHYLALLSLLIVSLNFIFGIFSYTPYVGIYTL